MKDLPLSTFLPIMLETAEMSSDVDELAEELENVSLRRDSGCSSHTPPTTRRQTSTTTEASARRRGSLPCDRPASAIRRHFNQLKVRRKTSAPSGQPPLIGPNKPVVTAVSASNPLAAMTGSPLIDLLEKLRPRQSSTSDSGVGSIPGSVTNRARVHRRLSVDAHPTSDYGNNGNGVDEGFHSGSGDDPLWKPLFVDTRLANFGSNAGPATVPRQCLYYRQSSLVGGGLAESQYHLQRQRSNSETARYLLMRKSGDVNGGSEFVGKLEAEWAYCQILATIKCCDLMPPMAKMVVVDANLTIRKAFHALVQNNIRAAPIWDGQRHLFVGLLTVTDLICMLIEHADGGGDEVSSSTTKSVAWTMPDVQTPSTNQESSIKTKSFEEMLNLPLHKRTTVQRRDSPKHSNGGGGQSTNQGNQQHCFNHLIYALAEENVSKAAKLLCDRRLHRLAILDPDNGGNALFLLSKKDILKTLQKYIAKLPLPACMEKTLDDLAIGTWSGLITVSPSTSLHQALSLFVSKGLSALPVVNENYHIVDMLTKVDVLNLVIENKGAVDDILKKRVEDAIRHRISDSEKMTTCSKKATLLLAVECMLHSDAHRLAIVDSDGVLEGVISIADLMRFLTSGFICE